MVMHASFFCYSMFSLRRHSIILVDRARAHAPYHDRPYRGPSLAVAQPSPSSSALYQQAACPD